MAKSKKRPMSRYKRLCDVLSSALLFWALLTLISASSEDNQVKVIAILSSDVQPYRDHLKHFKSGFPSRNIESVTLRNSAKLLKPGADKKGPDIILALGAPAADLAVNAQTNAKIIFSMIYDPADYFLSAGKSVCGIRLKVEHERVLSALESVWGRGRRTIKVGVLHLKDADSKEVDSLRLALTGKDHTIEVLEVSSPDDIGSSIQPLLKDIDVLWILHEPELFPDRQYFELVLKRAIANKVAVVGLSDAHVRLGALLAVSVDYVKEGEHAARLAKEIIEGRSPADIGIEGPENVFWSLNLSVAHEIGWEIDPLARKRFERVYP